MSTGSNNSIDISPVLKQQVWLNEIRNVGNVIGGLFLLFGLLFISEKPFLIVVVIITFLISNFQLAKAKLWAAITLFLICVSMTAFFEEDYQSSRQRILQSVQNSNENHKQFKRRKKWQLAMVENSRYLVYAMGAAALLYLVGLIIVLRYRQNAPKLVSRLTRRQRWKLNLHMFFAKVFTKGMLYWLAVWLCFGIVFSPFIYLFFKSRTENSWLLALLILALIGLITGLRLMAVAKSHTALSLASIGHIDARQPILLLRSFADDMTPILRTDDQNAWVRRLLAPTQWTLEETIEKQLTSYGPLIAIGRPGENMPPAGAAREYVPNEEWQQRVKELIKLAQAVVIILGDTPGLKFEYETLKQLGALPKVIAIFPPAPDERLEISWKYFSESTIDSSPVQSRPTPDLDKVIATFFDQTGLPRFVFCKRRDDEDCYRLALETCLANVSV